MVAKAATKPEFLVAKEKILVALATVSVAISCPVTGLFSNTRLIQVPGCRVTRSADHLSLVFTPEKNEKSWPG